MQIKDFTTGVQHIGIPTNDIKKTIEFFQLLGFDIAYRTINGPEEVAFLQLHNLVLETYQHPQATMESGAIDHIAIDVKNIDALFEEVKAKAIEAEKVATEKQATSLFRMLDTQVNGLPFWEKGVKFFTIEGPNKEKIEFCERL